MKQSLWKKILPVLLPIAVLALFALLDPNTRNLADVMDDIDPWWFLAAVGSMLLYYFFDTLMFQLAAKYMGLKHSFSESLLTTMFGLFYSSITPLQAGGQPAQVVQLRRYGISLGLSTSVLVLKFLAYQFGITLLGTLGFVFLGKDVLEGGVTMVILYVTGYLFYFGTVVLCFLALKKPQWLHRMGDRLIGFLDRKHILKKREKVENAYANWDRIIGEYGQAAGFALGEKLGMFYMWLAAMGTSVSYMAVTYFLYRGMGYSGYSLWYVVLLQCLLYIGVSFLPVPGGSVASEGGFYLVFSQLFAGASRFPAVLLWRGITYYLTILLGMLAVVIEGLRYRRHPADGAGENEPDTARADIGQTTDTAQGTERSEG